MDTSIKNYDNVNITIINEKTEEKIFITLFEVIEDVLKIGKYCLNKPTE